MYLKSIEMQGFKSFAQKIELDFQSGVTGIVGPNGSGKSNVADAVRWVLGEQSAKQLRSSNMQDVIFAGTQSRKPVGFASVVITFDNKDRVLAYDADEVAVSRRVYRSGESEYMLNGSACRLRDIQELFYDTGIGKEGYSIIGQGQIDRILSTKPEERRELFDEAAGIVKYKKRKLVAVRKLEKENESLTRVRDILGELEKQVGPLERQADKAREYLSLKEELKRFEVNQFLLAEEKRAHVLEDLTGKLKIAEEDLAAARLDTELLRRQHEDLDKEREELDQALTQERDRLQDLTVEKEAAEGRIGILRAQIETEETSRRHAANRRETLENERAERAEHVSRIREEEQELAETLAALEAESRTFEEQLKQADQSIAERDEEARLSREQVLQALQELADLGSRRQHFETLIEQNRLRQEQLADRLVQRGKEKEELSAQIDALTKAVEQLDRTGAALYKQLDGAHAQEEEKKQLRAQTEEDLSARLQQFHQISSRLESLQNLAERYEGYGGSVRSIMEARGRLSGIVGVVADLFHTQKQYETAIETALGNALQNVVTVTEDHAKKAVLFLKEGKRGRATFLPIDAVRDDRPFPEPEALRETGAVAAADELVTCDAKLDGIKRHLLSRTLVVKDMDSALAIARKYRYGLRMVTLEGELLSPGGSLTGGTYKNSSNLLGRRREITELSQQKEKAAQGLAAAREKLASLDGELAGLAERQEELKAQLQEKQLEKNTRTLEKKQREEQLAELTERSRNTEDESDRIAQQLRDMAQETEKIDERSRTLSEGRHRQEEAAASAEESVSGLRLQREEVMNRAAELSVRQNTALQRRLFLEETIGTLAQEEAAAQKELEELAQMEQASSLSGTEMAGEIETLQARIEEGRKRIEETAALVEEQTRQRDKRLSQQREIFARRDEAMDRQTLLEKETFRLQTQKEREEETAERQAAYLFEEYALTPSEAKAYRNEEFTLTQLTGRISALRSSIKALGNVNVNAIEDYKETKERYDFLKAQHDDLVRAADSLRQVISELEQGMRTQFTEKFKEIQWEFDIVFKELFGGGQGSLELMENEDVLEAGISIIAQPPGKKLQNMMQLSGGEKALTAISLLFAIQRLKPSPFCLLDEIEAALDDVNVVRFARYLDQLKDKIQFIVITHRRGTMTIADRLYGITMQEKGVSSLVSVDLTDAEE